MKVSEALQSRRSIRDFLPTPVPGEVIRRVLATAARAASGGNLQPWHIDVLAGAPLAELKALMQRRLQAVASGEPAEPTEYDIYPKALPSPYRDRRYQLGEAMYALLGIPHADKPARLRWFARNYTFFGAPMGLICSIDRCLGAPQWSDLGMFLQSVMLLLREEGLDSCAQESWSVFPRTVAGFLHLPAERMVFCGMAIGQRNPEHPVNQLVAERAPIEDFACFHGV